MAGVKGRGGGARPGAGRPKGPGKPAKPEKPREIDWKYVEYCAQRGVEEHDLREALGITEELLDAANADKFRQVFNRGAAVHRVELALRYERRTTISTRKDGSVNLLKALAQEKLGWGKEKALQEPEPDLGTARTRLKDLLLRLSRQSSESQGRTISVLELLNDEAEIVLREPDGPPA